MHDDQIVHRISDLADERESFGTGNSSSNSPAAPCRPSSDAGQAALGVMTREK
jgi:hypothetical protein